MCACARVCVCVRVREYFALRSRTIDLGTIGAYSYTEGGPLMANASVLPFGGAQSLEVAYGAGINLISNMYTAGRMEAFTRNLLYPTVVKIVEGLAATERLWLTKQSALAADTSLPEARRSIHSGRASRSRSKVSAMEALSATPCELYQASQIAFDFFDVNGTLDATARPTDRAEKGNNAITGSARPWPTPLRWFLSLSRLSPASGLRMACPRH